MSVPSIKDLANTNNFKPITADELIKLTSNPPEDKKYYAVLNARLFGSNPPISLEWDGTTTTKMYTEKYNESGDQDPGQGGWKNKEIDVKKLPFKKLLLLYNPINELKFKKKETVPGTQYTEEKYIDVSRDYDASNYVFYESVNSRGGSKRKSRKTKRRRRRAKKTRSNRK
jgi:hypothetical protein